MNLPSKRYEVVLLRQKAKIENGLKLEYYDDDSIGNKSTEVSWGLCSEAAWPDAEDHLWPDKFLANGRVAPLYRTPEQMCPLDARLEKDQVGSTGCFYTCRIFKARRGAVGKLPMPDNKEAIRLYDVAIERLKRW